MHAVEIDPEAINAQFEAYAQQAPEPDPLTGEHIPGGEPEQNTWQDEAEMAAIFLFGRCPNWDVPQDKQQKFADALARVLTRVAPGGLMNVDKWGPWGQLAYAAGACALCGVDLETFTFKPLHPPDVVEADQDADQEQEKTPGRYTTGA